MSINCKINFPLLVIKLLIFLERFDEGLFPSIVGLRFCSRKISGEFTLLFVEFFPFCKVTFLKIESISSCVKMSIEK